MKRSCEPSLTSYTWYWHAVRGEQPIVRPVSEWKTTGNKAPARETASGCGANAGVTFEILVGSSEADGQAPFGTDPLSQAYLQGGEPPNAALLRLMLALVRPGQTVLDLGAHIGTFTLTATAAGCRVVAIEASPGNARL